MIERNLEKRVFSNAASIVTVSQPLSEQLSLLHKNNKLYTIPNGFDPDIQPSIEFDNVFSMTYPGELCDGKWDPSLLFLCLQELINEEKFIHVFNNSMS